MRGAAGAWWQKLRHSRAIKSSVGVSVGGVSLLTLRWEVPSQGNQNETRRWAAAKFTQLQILFSKSQESRLTRAFRSAGCKQSIKLYIFVDSGPQPEITDWYPEKDNLADVFNGLRIKPVEFSLQHMSQNGEGVDLTGSVAQIEQLLEMRSKHGLKLELTCCCYSQGRETQKRIARAQETIIGKDVTEQSIADEQRRLENILGPISPVCVRCDLVMDAGYDLKEWDSISETLPQSMALSERAAATVRLASKRDGGESVVWKDKVENGGVSTTIERCQTIRDSSKVHIVYGVYELHCSSKQGLTLAGSEHWRSLVEQKAVKEWKKIHQMSRMPIPSQMIQRSESKSLVL